MDHGFVVDCRVSDILVGLGVVVATTQGQNRLRSAPHRTYVRALWVRQPALFCYECRLVDNQSWCCEGWGSAIVMIVLGEAILAQVLVPREDGVSFLCCGPHVVACTHGVHMLYFQVEFWVQVFCGLAISYLLHVSVGGA